MGPHRIPNRHLGVPYGAPWGTPWGPLGDPMGAHGAPGPRESASTAQRCPGRPWGSSACSRRADSKKLKQVWEADGDIYWLSWLIICPARRPGELFGGSGKLGEAVPDH